MMTVAAEAAVVAAVAVLGIAAVAKLTDRASFRAWLTAGRAGAIAGPLSLLVPLTELAVVAVLVVAGPRWAGAAATAVLAVATLYLRVELDRGERCTCFGAWSAVDRGQALRRNALLLALAGSGAAAAPAETTSGLILVAGVCLSAAVLLSEAGGAKPVSATGADRRG